MPESAQASPTRAVTSPHGHVHDFFFTATAWVPTLRWQTPQARHLLAVRHSAGSDPCRAERAGCRHSSGDRERQDPLLSTAGHGEGGSLAPAYAGAGAQSDTRTCGADFWGSAVPQWRHQKKAQKSPWKLRLGSSDPKVNGWIV